MFTIKNQSDSMKVNKIVKILILNKYVYESICSLIKKIAYVEINEIKLINISKTVYQNNTK